MKKILSKEFIIGFCVILTLVILFFGIEFLKGVNVFKASNYYYASFSNVTGLAQSAPVTINGFKVGLVRHMEYEQDNPGHIRVEMILDEGFKVPRGSKVALASDLLGTASLQLDLAGNTDYLPTGSTLEGTNPAGLMESVSQGLLPAIDGMLPKVDSILTSLNALASDPALSQSIKRLDVIMANMEQTSKALNMTMQRVQPIVTNFDHVSGNLGTASDDIVALTHKLSNLPLDSAFVNVVTMTGNLANATSQLNDKNSSLGKLLYSDGLYNNLNHTVQSVDSLINDIKRNPKRYISIKLL